MKNLQYLFLAIVLSISCRKDTRSSDNLSSVRIVNTVSGGTTAMINSYGYGVPSNFNLNYSFYPNTSNLYIFPAGDSLHPYFASNKLELKERGIYTLFLGGPPDAVESLFMEESFPYLVDSICAIRFVHLAPGGPAVNVTLSSTPGVNEFSHVEYKGITEFKYIPAKMENNQYEFQVRDATDPNKILASIFMYDGSLDSFVPRFRFVTLVFRDKVDGFPPAGITRVNHYPGLYF